MAALAQDVLAQYPLSVATRAFLDRAGPMFIDGQWVAAKSGRTIDVFDPATARVIAQVADADKPDVDLAVKAARRALESSAWADMKPAGRELLLLRLADAIEKNFDELAELESLNVGKLLFFSRMIDIGTAPSFVRYMAGWATKIEGSTITPSADLGPGTKFHAFTLKEPVGVVAAVIPWNFPLAMALWKMCPALATGSTIVIKPAEQTPLTALRLAELVAEVGIPPGVVNIVTGLGETAGAALTAHPGIDKIAFTGSTDTGKLIARAAAENVTRLSLELGGKSPVIVLPDADVDVTIRGAVNGIFFNHGQVCTAGSRLYVHKKLYADVVDGVADAARGMKLGPGLAPDSQMGPLVSKEQQDRVTGFIESGIKEGARVVTGGLGNDLPGYFVKPTVLGETRPEMKVVREEIFGPVLSCASFDDLDEVVRQANDTRYGLAASIFSNNLTAVHRLIPRLKAGTVWVNHHNLVDPAVPFGGYKQSGMGREMAKMVIDMYTENKSVFIAM
jgi:phenylacetaldehyde dehydrogenase